MKAELLRAREVAPTAGRTTRRVHVGAEFFAAAFASIVVEHVRPMLAPVPTTNPVQGGGGLPLAKMTPLASTSMLEAALSNLCSTDAQAAPEHTSEAAPLAASPIELVAISATETKVTIEHPDLGTIRLSLSLEGSALLVQATTDSRTAHTAVSLCAPALRSALSAQGLSLRSLDVSIHGEDADDDPRPRARKRRGLDTEA